MADQHLYDNGVDNRRPWIQRYMSLVIFILATLISMTGTLIVTWANAKSAVKLSEENKAKLESRTPIIHQVPALDSKLEDHIESFSDFRTEQRSYNKNINEKLDYLVRNTG